MVPIQTAYSGGRGGTNKIDFPVSTSTALKQSASYTRKINVQWKLRLKQYYNEYYFFIHLLRNIHIQNSVE